MIEVIVTDRNLVILDPLRDWTSVDCTIKFNEPGSGQITVPLTRTAAQLLTPGNRIAISRRLPNGTAEWFMAGPIERPGTQQWSQDGDRTLTVGFTDDLALIVSRLLYPSPAAAITAQVAARRSFSATNAEDVMQTLVDENAGPTALAARRIPALVIASDASVGTNVTMSFRLDKLGDALRSVATAGGHLGFRTQQVDNTIEFQVYEPENLVDQVRFSVGYRNLISYSYAPEAPKSTVAIVGDGSGDGTSRVFRERISGEAATWWRLESLVDRSDITDTTELDAAGDEELANQAATVNLAAICIETDGQRYGQHFRAGDLVGVELATGDVVADIIREVNLAATPDEGEQIALLIGTQDATQDPLWQAFHRLQRDVHRLKSK